MSAELRCHIARTSLILLVALGGSASLVQAQTSGRILKEAPLFLLADATRQPLLIMEAGVVVEVHRREGNWVNVTVEGSQLGKRTGYVESRFIEVMDRTPAPPRITVDTAIRPKSTETPAPVTQVQKGPPARTAAPTAVTSRPEVFQRSKLNTTVDDRTRESDVIVRYEDGAFVIVDRKSGEAAKTFPYAVLKGAEYSYSKNPRWKTAIFVSPLFLFTSGKKHWFLVKADGDYALLQLDKSNYRLILAAFEARTGLKVETVADTK